MYFLIGCRNDKEKTEADQERSFDHSVIVVESLQRLECSVTYIPLQVSYFLSARSFRTTSFVYVGNNGTNYLSIFGSNGQPIQQTTHQEISVKIG